MKALKKVWEAITYPFVAISVMLGTSQEINEDGRFDRYWERRNRREMKKAAKRGRC